jgi:hypothetical protein
MREFTGKAGNIYIQKCRNPKDDHLYEVWFEDFCIMGNGDSELEALRDASRYTGDILALISEAILSVGPSAGD